MGQQLDPGAAQFSDMEAAPQHKDLDPGFDIDATTASVPAASSAEPNALDFNFDSEPTPAAGQDLAAPMNLQADNGLDFKLDDLELTSLDVDKHDVANELGRASCRGRGGQEG